MGGSNLERLFDVVVMLTWSSWHDEPRSNRYHYATRFGKEVPVLFVQPRGNYGELLLVEPVEEQGIEIVYYDTTRPELATHEFYQLLRARGYLRPLVWIYNARDYRLPIDMLKRTGSAYFVYHATENYFTKSEVVLGDLDTGSLVCELVSECDLVIAVSDAVARAYEQHIDADVTYRVVKNGCDYGFAENVRSLVNGTPRSNVALYQGGLNSRVDFNLLHELIHLLPDWEFRFCGREAPDMQLWELLKTHPNVVYLGELDIDELGRETALATVGLIPFIQDDWIRASLPLKAYEYVSYGLPVVSVPIDELADNADLFTIATSADEFATAIKDVCQSRFDERAIADRYQRARLNSYDRRYEQAVDFMVRDREIRQARAPLNAVLLYDERHTDVNTIREHLEAFQKYSKHNFFFVPATGIWPISADELEVAIDLSIYDVVIVHYSTRISLPDYFNEGLARQVERHPGTKILFIQDEYEKTETARRWMDRLQFRIVYTCVPDAYVENIYPKHRFPATEFLPTLTGYVPELGALDRFARPIEERELYIGYRGRKLPYIYGELGYEKYRIGVDVKRFAEERFFPVDIETDDSKRIYGDDWYRFLGSVRATLGTESGSSIFDFTGEVAAEVNKVLKRNPAVEFEEIQESLLKKYEGHAVMNQISPKIFEAIRLRTALILFEGSYSGVVEADRHYIPLKKDYSNIDEVFAKLEDTDFLVELTDRAYTDIIDSGEYSYRSFVEKFDQELEARHPAEARYSIACHPTLAFDRHGNVKPVLTNSPFGYMLESVPLGRDLQREQIPQMISKLAYVETPPPVAIAQFESVTATSTEIEQINVRFRFVRGVWRVLPVRVRNSLRRIAVRFIQRNEFDQNKTAVDFRFAQRIWHILPTQTRIKVANMLRN